MRTFTYSTIVWQSKRDKTIKMQSCKLKGQSPIHSMSAKGQKQIFKGAKGQRSIGRNTNFNRSKVKLVIVKGQLKQQLILEIKL